MKGSDLFSLAVKIDSLLSLQPFAACFFEDYLNELRKLPPVFASRPVR